MQLVFLAAEVQQEAIAAVGEGHLQRGQSPLAVDAAGAGADVGLSLWTGHFETQIGLAAAVLLVDRAGGESGYVLDRLAEIRADGVAIGLSTSGPDQSKTIRRAISIEREDTQLFSTVQATWNLLEPSAGEALAEAHDAGMGVIIKESVANGRLTERDRKTVAPLREAFPDENADTIAVAAILAQSWVDTVISGAATVEQLESNVAALAVDPAALAALPDMREEPSEYWGTRSGLKWT